MSRSGSCDSSTRIWAITSFAETSSIWFLRKMMRSSKSFEYGFVTRSLPFAARSMNDGTS